MTTIARLSPAELESVAASLAPVRRALLDEAEAATRSILVAAREEAASRIRKEETAADDAVRRAVERRERASQAAFDQMMAAERSRSDRLVRVRRSEHVAALVDETVSAARSMRSDERYPRLLEALAERARVQLGPEAGIEADRTEAGGVIGELGHHRVDYSLDALARRALTRLADEVAEVVGQ
ncbi:MAG: hypothetical protein R2710_29710 [Acidimicrobiales bacterium]